MKTITHESIYLGFEKKLDFFLLYSIWYIFCITYVNKEAQYKNEHLWTYRITWKAVFVFVPALISPVFEILNFILSIYP